MSSSETFNTRHALTVITVMVCSCRFKDMSADHGSVAKELERANEEFKEFERKDIKYREDLKHVKAKLKKLQEKLNKDTTKMEVGLLLKQLNRLQWTPRSKTTFPIRYNRLQCICYLCWHGRWQLLLATPWNASANVGGVAAAAALVGLPILFPLPCSCMHVRQ